MNAEYDPMSVLDDGYKYHKQAWLDVQISNLINNGSIPNVEVVERLSSVYDAIVTKGAMMGDVPRSNVVEVDFTSGDKEDEEKNSEN